MNHRPTTPHATSRDFLTAAEIAELTAFSLRTIRRWIASGQLPVVKLGGRLRIRRTAFEQFLIDRTEVRTAKEKQ